MVSLAACASAPVSMLVILPWSMQTSARTGAGRSAEMTVTFSRQRSAGGKAPSQAPRRIGITMRIIFFANCISLLSLHAHQARRRSTRSTMWHPSIVDSSASCKIQYRYKGGYKTRPYDFVETTVGEGFTPSPPRQLRVQLTNRHGFFARGSAVNVASTGKFSRFLQYSPSKARWASPETACIIAGPWAPSVILDDAGETLLMWYDNNGGINLATGPVPDRVRSGSLLWVNPN